MKRSEIIFGAVRVPLDFLMLVLAGIGAYWFRLSPVVAQFRPVLFDLPFDRFSGVVMLVSFTWILIFAVLGLYSMRKQSGVISEIPRIIIATSAGLAIIVIYIFIKREWFESRFIILFAWILSIFFVVFGRILLRIVQEFITRYFNIGTHWVLIFGDDEITKKIVDEINMGRTHKYRLAENLAEIDINKAESVYQNRVVDDVILSNPDYPKDKVLELVEWCEDKRIGFKFVPNLFQTLTTNFVVSSIATAPIIELKPTRLDGWGRVIKRTIDLLGSLIGLIILLPLFIIIGLIIKLDSKGPIFFISKRISQNKEFGLYKFRSMVKDADIQKDKLLNLNERQDGPLFKITNDPRVTRFGKFMRKTRIDELPQLANVFLGQISLVGPRPHLPKEIANYQRHHKKLLTIKAGITGMAQISGSSDLPFEDEVRLDTFYIENWSLGLDMKILFKTFWVAWRDKSA